MKSSYSTCHHKVLSKRQLVLRSADLVAGDQSNATFNITAFDVPKASTRMHIRLKYARVIGTLIESDVFVRVHGLPGRTVLSDSSHYTFVVPFAGDFVEGGISTPHAIFRETGDFPQCIDTASIATLNKVTVELYSNRTARYPPTAPDTRDWIIVLEVVCCE